MDPSVFKCMKVAEQKRNYLIRVRPIYKQIHIYIFSTTPRKKVQQQTLWATLVTEWRYPMYTTCYLSQTFST